MLKISRKPWKMKPFHLITSTGSTWPFVEEICLILYRKCTWIVILLWFCLLAQGKSWIATHKGQKTINFQGRIQIHLVQSLTCNEGCVNFPNVIRRQATNQIEMSQIPTPKAKKLNLNNDSHCLVAANAIRSNLCTRLSDMVGQRSVSRGVTLLAPSS